MAALSGLGKFKNTGLLVIRLGLGIMFILAHGYPKLAGGAARWELVGSAMANFGIDFAPVFWGLAAALTETIGGVLLILGLFFRPVALILALIMLVASSTYFAAGTGLSGAAHAIEMGVVLIGLAFVGPGKYSVDKR